MLLTLIAFAVLTFFLLTRVIWKMIELDEREEELDKYSVYLDERANRIAMDEDSITSEWLELNKAKKELKK